jgi:hypothetical protein
MNRYVTKSQNYDICKNHPLFAKNPDELAPNLPQGNDSHEEVFCSVPGCWYNKPIYRMPSPSTPLNPVNAGATANGKKGFQEPSGPEAREVPQGSSLLVNNGQSSIAEWGKKHRRQYQRLMTLLYRWESMGLSIVRLDLTTSIGGDPKLMTKHYETLRRRIERKIGKRVHYWWVQTQEGNGVLHTLMAAEGSLYIEQEWLSEQWEEIHGAIIVYIKRYKKGAYSRKRVSKYLVSQYLAGQLGNVRMGWSWKRTFNIPISKAWKLFCKSFRNRKFCVLLSKWQAFLRGEDVDVGGAKSISIEKGLFVNPEWGWAYGLAE